MRYFMSGPLSAQALTACLQLCALGTLLPLPARLNGLAGVLGLAAFFYVVKNLLSIQATVLTGSDLANSAMGRSGKVLERARAALRFQVKTHILSECMFLSVLTIHIASTCTHMQ